MLGSRSVAPAPFNPTTQLCTHLLPISRGPTLLSAACYYWYRTPHLSSADTAVGAALVAWEAVRMYAAHVCDTHTVEGSHVMYGHRPPRKRPLWRRAGRHLFQARELEHRGVGAAGWQDWRPPAKARARASRAVVSRREWGGGWRQRSCAGTAGRLLTFHSLAIHDFVRIALVL